MGWDAPVPAETTATFSPRLVDGLVDAILIIDGRGCIVYANRAVGSLLGHDPRWLFDRPFTALLPEGRRVAWGARLAELARAVPPPRSQAPIRETVLRADGTHCPVAIGTFLVAPDGAARLVVAALWDVSDRIDIERYQRVADDLLAFLARASGTIDDIVPQLLGILARSLEFGFAAAWRWEPDPEVLQCSYVWRRSPAEFAALAAASTGLTVRPGEGLPGMVVSSNEPVWTTRLTRAPYLKRHHAIVADGVQTAFVLPIRTRDRLVGVIELFTEVARTPERPLVVAVADVCAKLGEFIERLELEEHRRELLAQLERSQVQQAFLLRANRALVEAHDFVDTISRLAEVAVPTLGDICLIDVLTADGSLERLAARHADPARQALTDRLAEHAPDIDGQHPAALAVRTGSSQWSADMTDDFMQQTTHGRGHLQLTRALQFQSYLSVPLKTDDAVIGALTTVTTGTEPPLLSPELPLAEELAQQVAAVIQRARELDEQSTIARRLQASLLPSAVGQVPGLSVAARYSTSERGAQVGGDFYDVVPLSAGHVAMVVGDVEGHDMVAATVMGQLRSALRAYLLLTPDPGEVLGLLDRYLLGQPTERLATALLGVLDRRTGRLRLASAGHPAPYLHHRVAASLVELEPGPPLGYGSARYPVREITFEPLARLVCYTDGLIDDGRAGAAEVRTEMEARIAAGGSADSERLADDILAVVSGSGALADDIALLVVQWLGPADGTPLR